MANWEHCAAVERGDGHDGGLWMFKDTSVPLYALYETLASGATVNDFATRFGVEHKQVVEALRYEADELHDYRLNCPDGVSRMHNPGSANTGPDAAMWRTCPLVEQNPGILAGAWIFKSTRFPLYAVHDNLASGATLDEFDEWYEIEKDKVVALLHFQSKALRGSQPAYVDTV